MSIEDRYTHGHQESVVAAHAARTIENSAQYLEPYLTDGISLLDVGCGPGSITAEFAERVGSNGEVLGIDTSEEVVDRARASYPESSARFATGDAYRLDAADNTYDVAHAHQVLQHVSDPVAVLREMRRVVKPGGVVAVRDADYAAMHWAPQSDALDNWLSVYRDVAKSNDAEPDAGRYLVKWAREAGFTEVHPSLDTWLFAEPDRRAWWGGTWAERVVSSSLAEQAVEHGLASPQDLAEMSTAWRTWLAEPDGWFVVVHGQLICTV